MIDRDNFLDSLDAFQNSDSKQQFDIALDAFRSRVQRPIDSVDDVREVVRHVNRTTLAARRLLADYESLSEKPLRISASAGLTTGRVTDVSALTISLRRTLVGGALIRLSREDTEGVKYALSTLDGVSNAVDLLIEGDAVPLAAALLNVVAEDRRLPEREDLTSSFLFQGARSTEIGLSYSPHQSPFLGWHWGATLKTVEFQTVDYEQRLTEADIGDFNTEEHKKTYHDPNIDLGVNRRLSRYWRLGLAIRNAIPYDYRTVRDNTVKLRPLARIALAYEGPCCTITADLDLTRNDPLGFDPEKRYLALGAEWRIGRNTALRGGYRYNTVSGSGLYSLGVGLGSQQLHADVAAAAYGDELGVSLQIAAYF